ncbi:alpha/beta-hydrolase, partial [Dentipellis sp. KUC8613]
MLDLPLHKALGPFPIHAREQHFLSPSFPLDFASPIDFEKSWSSSYADGGQVSWSTAYSDANGNVKIAFPDIRWNALRATEGWAALQHHSVLHTTLTVHPPDNASQAPQLLFDLKQGTFFTILPRLPNNGLSELAPEWYTGNVYNMERSLPQPVWLPSPPSLNSSTVYDVYVSGDYEIRLFGSPHLEGREYPVLDVTLSVQPESPAVGLIHEPSHDIVCDFVDGFAFGDALGVGLRSVSGWWTVTSASIPGPSDHGLTVELVNKSRLAPGQTRILPLRIHQTAPFDRDTLGIQLDLVSGAVTAQVFIDFNIYQQSQSQWREHATPPIRASYFFAESMPTIFLVHSPFSQTPYGETPKPPLLATHGAGVDIIEQSFWAEALPRQERSWIIMPTGLTSWGLDWHGPSAQEAWSTVDALGAILQRNPPWHSWKLADNTKVVLLGHSNGGQGAWYLASRYPDRVVAVIPASGYIKAQSYVPLTLSRSAHFIDPSLRAVLETAFTPDDNDLFLSNLVDTPIFAIHGGNDTNVPTWHTREAVSLLKTWSPDANVIYHEDPGEPHWYPKVFANDHVQGFLDSVLVKLQAPETWPTKGFTLTVSNPAESGSLHGWRIMGLHVPGRIARLTVQEEAGVISVSTQNVKSFSLDRRRTPALSLVVDDIDILLTQLHGNVARIESRTNGWQAQEAANLINVPQKSGRLA